MLMSAHVLQRGAVLDAFAQKYSDAVGACGVREGLTVASSKLVTQGGWLAITSDSFCATDSEIASVTLTPNVMPLALACWSRPMNGPESPGKLQVQRGHEQGFDLLHGSEQTDVLPAGSFQPLR